MNNTLRPFATPVYASMVDSFEEIPESDRVSVSFNIRIA
jgi:hypothetical protein